jgi:hypothetical protein
VEAALDDVRACEVAGYDHAVKELRRRLKAADAEPPDPAALSWVEQFSTVTTRMYYQKVGPHLVLPGGEFVCTHVGRLLQSICSPCT